MHKKFIINEHDYDKNKNIINLIITLDFCTLNAITFYNYY